MLLSAHIERVSCCIFGTLKILHLYHWFFIFFVLQARSQNSLQKSFSLNLPLDCKHGKRQFLYTTKICDTKLCDPTKRVNCHTNCPNLGKKCRSRGSIKVIFLFPKLWIQNKNYTFILNVLFMRLTKKMTNLEDSSFFVNSFTFSFMS